MESHKITALFARFYGERMTWDGHLQLVDHLESWTVDQLLAFQEALLDHLAAGRWVGTVPNLRIDIPGGGARGADYPLHRDEEHLNAFMNKMRVGAGESQLAALDSFAEAERFVLGWKPDPELRYDVPGDCIGIPIASWLHEGPRERVSEEQRPQELRNLKRRARQDFSDGADQLVWILRAAPWAHVRKTGRRLAGYPPLAFEERESAEGALTWYSIAMHLVSRSGEYALVISVVSTYTEELASNDVRASLKGVARRVGARVLPRPVEVQRGADAESRTWLLRDGQLVWEGAALGGPKPRHGIVGALDTILGGEDQTAGYAEPLDDPVFWRLIESLPNRLRDGDVTPLVESLVRLSGKRILGFAESLARKLGALDQPELLQASQSDSVIPMSADVFLYARCAVVASGREAFDRVLGEGKIVESEWPVEYGEHMLMAVAEAYTEKTGEDYEYEPSVSYETGGGRPVEPRSDRVATSIRSRRQKDGESVDTVIEWRTGDIAEARNRHLNAVSRLYEENSQLIDEVLFDFDRVAPTVAISGVAYYCGVDL